MLDRTDKNVDTAIRAFTGHRAQLRDRLLEACTALPPRAACAAFASTGTVRPGPPKYLFHVTDGRTIRRVHNHLLELKALLPRIDAACRQAALDQGLEMAPLDLAKERGLWLPLVIDTARGDRQVNVMTYANRATRVLPAAAAVALVGAEGADDPALLKMQAIARQHATVRLCRDAGDAYRLLVRGNHRRTELMRGGVRVVDDYEIHNLREFAIVLGKEILINLPITLPKGMSRRQKRKDALALGAPLHTFRGATDGNQWSVYPVPAKTTHS